MIRRVASAYALWASRQESAALDPGSTMGAWVVAALFIYGLIAGCVALGEIAKTDVVMAALAPVPVISLGLTGAGLRRWGRLDWSGFLVFVALGTGFLVFTFAVLLLLAAGPAAWFFAAIVILTASLHAWVTKSGTDAPVSGIAALGGMALAISLVPRIAALPLFGMTVALSLYLSLQIGTWSSQGHVERMKTESYREALQAQMLAEQVSRIGNLQQSITELMALRHDQRNVLFSLAMNVGNLADEVESAMAKSILMDMQDAIDQMSALQDQRSLSLPASDGGIAKLEAVVILDVASTVARIVGVRYGHVRVALELPSSVPPVLMRGGAPALHRVLLNMMLNACEGDGGPTRATSVALAARRHPGGDVVSIEVTDDGPGFPAAVLGARAPFHTTKQGGTGLGLVTVQGLVSASGGKLTIRNGEAGGATVTLQLTARAE